MVLHNQLSTTRLTIRGSQLLTSRSSHNLKYLTFINLTLRFPSITHLTLFIVVPNRLVLYG